MAIGCMGVDRIELYQKRVKWWGFVDTNEPRWLIRYGVLLII